MATDGVQAPADGSNDYVQFTAAGKAGKGEYRCSDCSYAVTVHSTLPVCPRCSGSSWERAPWSPFSRASDRLEAEQALDLVPDHDRQADARCEHGREREPEA